MCSLLGLAQTAVHRVSADLLGPLKLFEVDQIIKKQTGVINKILPQGPLAVVSEDVQPKASSANDQVEYSNDNVGNIHALSILARIMHDSRINPPSSTDDQTEMYDATIEKYGDSIAEHIRAWTINVSKLIEGNTEELNRKIEEVVWVICTVYGIGGWTGRESGIGGQFNADFFL